MSKKFRCRLGIHKYISLIRDGRIEYLACSLCKKRKAVELGLPVAYSGSCKPKMDYWVKYGKLMPIPEPPNTRGSVPMFRCTQESMIGRPKC